MIKKDYPDESELVVGTVVKVQNFGAFVTLDEYPNKEGFVHIAEVATGWVKRIRNHIKEKQKVVCKVMNVDEEKGHVDLSLKRVNEHQRREKIQEWKNAQKSRKLLEIVANQIGKTVDQCFNEFGVRLSKKYGSLFGAFEEAAIDEKTLENDGFSGEWVDAFIETAKTNITIPFVDIKGYIDVTSYLPNGIDHIKDVLTKAEESEYDDVDIQVKYIGAPHYMIAIRAPDYKVAEDQLKKAVSKIQELIKDFNGTCEFHRKLEE